MSRSSSSTNEQTRTEIDPQLKDAYLGNFNQAKGVGDFITAQGPYSGPRAGSAPMGGAGQQAGSVLNQLANGIQMDIPEGAPGASIGQAWDTLAQARQQPSLEVGSYGYNPQPFQMQGATVGAAASNVDTINRDAVRDVNPYVTPRQNVRDLGFGTVAGGMGAYTNAYADGVIGRGLQDLDRARQLTQQQNSAQAVRQGAFGGSRQAVLEGETNRGFADAAARLIAEQRAAGFNTAANLANTDITNAQRAGAANQAADLNMAGMYMDAANRAQAANQQMDFATAAANQGALNAGSENNAARSQQAALASAQFGQQAGAANQAAALDAQRFNAQSRQQADLANQAANQNRIAQLLQTAGQYQNLAGMQYQMPLQTAQALQQFDNYGRGVYNENAQAAQSAFDDSRYYMLPALQVQSGALGINLPNLGMSSTGSSKSTYTPSGLQTIGQLAQIGGMFF